MNLEDGFKKFVAAECDPGTDIKFRALVSKKPYSTGRYFHPSKDECARVTITFGTDVPDNIMVMLHELSHHLDWVANPFTEHHPRSFWRILFRLASKYEARMPGIINAIYRNENRQNGVYLHVARAMNIPGAQQIWEELNRQNDIKNAYRRVAYEREMKVYREQKTDQALDFLYKEA